MVFAKVTHERSFVDQAPSFITLDVVADDYDQDINCGGLRFWGVLAIEHKTGDRFSSTPRFIDSTILSQEFTLNLPAGDYEEIMFVCSDDGENEAFQFGSIQNDLSGDQIIFTSSADAQIEAQPASVLEKVLDFLPF